MQLPENLTDSVANQIPQTDSGLSAEFPQQRPQESIKSSIEPDAVLPASRFELPVPAVIADAGPRAAERFFEFFTATIRNRNTRRAYARSVGQFFVWCGEHGYGLHHIRPFMVAAYIENHGGAKPSVKVSLAAIRMLFDWLVVGQVVPMNPASSVRGPKHIVKTGKTPALSAEQARELLDRIPGDSIAGMRDRAVIATMCFSFARVGAVIGMNVEDYFQNGKRWWIRLHEKGSKRHEVPAHHSLEEYLDAYMTAAKISEQTKEPLFRTIDQNRALTPRRMSENDVLRMVKRRGRQAGLPTSTCCHTFRATGITTFLENGGTIDEGQPYYLLRARMFSLGKVRRFKELRAFREPLAVGGPISVANATAFSSRHSSA